MNEADLLRRSAEEREKIFQRYERGREDGAEIDPWEDPGFEVYHATDRYGFIHDKRLPSKVDPQEAKKLQIELERQKKWLKMLKNWPTVLDSVAHKEKLQSRVFKGIPNSLRTKAWCRLLDVDTVKANGPGKYGEMLQLARKHSTDARQIDSDVNRQFREHLYYRERYSIKQQSLFNVLTAYAMFNSEVGYCQGMSGLAGVLLMYMDEEDAFWAVHILLTDPKYAMHGLYKEGFPKLTRFLAHHDKILTKFLPKLKKHFDKHGVDAILYSLKWFFVCFIERVPFNLCLRIWDVHLLVGERVITAMAFTILKMHKRSLLKLKDMDSIVQYIQVRLHKDFMYDDDLVVNQLEKSLDELKRAKLDHPGPPQKDELPQRPFGSFAPPTFEQIVGRRAEQFTDKEEETRGIVTLTSLNAKRDSAVIDDNKDESSLGLAGSKFSFDDGSSILDCCEADLEHTSGSRRCSLAETSVTSTADLSLFSTSVTPRSQDKHDHQQQRHNGGAGEDTHSNMSDDDTSVASGCHFTTNKQQNSSSNNNNNDVLRIYVPYTPLDAASLVSPQRHANGDLTPHHGNDSSNHSNGENRIRIKVVDNGGSHGDELLTPLVEHGRIKAFGVVGGGFNDI